MELSAGTLWRLRRLADSSGFLTMLATDQRPPIERLVSQRRREDEPRHEDLAAVKRALISELGPHASAVLVDPIVGYPEGIDTTDPHRGLLVTLEHAVYEETPGGRLSGPIPGWSVEAIARLGADAVKVLAWYRPDAAPAVREHQQRWVSEVGTECRRHDIPFLFELLVYPFAGTEGTGDSYAEDQQKRSEAVLESVETFAGPEYGVTVFKVESPIPAATLAAESEDTVQFLFDSLGRAAGRPWVVLSAGADQATFTRVVAHACRAGASGFLAGRAIWWDALQRFPDLGTFTEDLRNHSVPYLRELSELVQTEGRPWHSHPCFQAGDFRLDPGWYQGYARG